MKINVIPFPPRPKPSALAPAKTVPIVGYVGDDGRVVFTLPRARPTQ